MSLLSRIPVYPLLFAAYAILFLYAANLALVLPVDAAAPLAVRPGASPGAGRCPRLVLRDLRRGAIVATAAVVAFFAFGHVSAGLTANGLDDRAQLALWAVVIVAALVYAIRAHGSLPSVTAGFNVFAVVLVVIAAPSIVPYEIVRAGRQPDHPRAGRPRQRDPDLDARHLLPDLRPLRVGGIDPAPLQHHGQRPLRLAPRSRLPGASPQPRQLPGDRLLARRDAQHALPR